MTTREFDTTKNYAGTVSVSPLFGPGIHHRANRMLDKQIALVVPEVLRQNVKKVLIEDNLWGIGIQLGWYYGNIPPQWVDLCEYVPPQLEGADNA